VAPAVMCEGRFVGRTSFVTWRGRALGAGMATVGTVGASRSRSSPPPHNGRRPRSTRFDDRRRARGTDKLFGITQGTADGSRGSLSRRGQDGKGGGGGNGLFPAVAVAHEKNGVPGSAGGSGENTTPFQDRGDINGQRLVENVRRHGLTSFATGQKPGRRFDGGRGQGATRPT